MPCLAASRLTMNSPSWSLLARSNSAGLARRWLMASRSWRAQAKAAVVDLRDQARPDPVRPDLDPRVGRREHRRVLHELGDEVDDVVDRVARDQVARFAGDVDPARSPRPRRRPRAARRRRARARATPGPAWSPDRMMRPSACLRMRVVRWSRRKSSASAVGIAGAALHGVEHLQLPVQQRLIAHGDVQEDLADALAQPRLVDRRRDRRPLHRGEGIGDGGDFPDGARAGRRGFREDVHVLAAPEPADDPRQPFLRHLADGAVQSAEVPGDLAAEPDQEEHRHHDRGEADAAGD